MCGEMGKAVLRALTGALLCGLVSDAAYLQQYDPYQQYEPQVYRKPLREHEKPQDLRNVPGIPGVDYPIYHEVPETRFSCAHVPVHPGMYANVETGCQAYHVCHDGREGHQGASFLCTNGTLFDQAKFACDWWYNVDCSQAIEHYKLNADPLKNPYVPKPKPEELEHQGLPHGIYYKKL
ncbi:U-scoloptoxin(01)-Cw1a-like [Amyelois transitella]|uniref:U-scoloptoxin(01)-Cw1a-like n=1 Tax=Amyelois transitella TaxID=680683 RepID=UPI00299021A7|nr:U-scoloptoxin(01)-Cw1a-like [Amyelois transitella]